MAITLTEFADRLHKAAKRIPQNVQTVAQEVAVAVQDTLIETTPVLTGKARTNWRVYENEQGGETIPKPDSPEAGMQAALSQGQSAVLAIPVSAPIYIINKAEYIEKLNNGSSQQAPSNFVRISSQRVADVISKRRKVIVELK